MADIEKAVDKLKWIIEINSSRTVNPDEAQALLAHILELRGDIIKRQDRLACLREAVREMTSLADGMEEVNGGSKQRK